MAVVVLQCAIETIEVAFLLNVAIFLAIQVCSGLVYSLAGIVKDRLLTLDTEPSDKCRWGGAAIRRCYHVTSAKESWFDTKVVSWRFQAVKVGRKHWDHPNPKCTNYFFSGKSMSEDPESACLRDLYL